MIKPRESKKTLFTFHCSNSNMTSLVEHTELKPTVLRFLPKELKPEKTVLLGASGKHVKFNIRSYLAGQP